MASSVTVIELCKITPPPDSATATESSSLPLTFFDTLWFKFHPVERIFFYKLTTDSDSASFFSSILPSLKHSLSLTLLHFLPFAGNLVWPSNSDKPFIHYTPGDGVSLTVSESNADFDALSSDTIREIPDSHQYVPELNVTETEAETLSFQITLFPGKGFCIGVCSHHGIFDGKSIIMFLKSWAYVCKQPGGGNGNITLPPELTPVLDRTVIKDPEGLDMVYINSWMKMASFSGTGINPKSLKLFDMARSTLDNNFVRGTFTLSYEDINKIRHKTLSQLDYKGNSKHFSTFILAYTYVVITITKAKRFESKKTLILGFPADVRARLNPPVPANYFGNCVFTNIIQTHPEFVVKEDGLAFVVEELTKLVKGLEKDALNGAKEKIELFTKFNPNLVEAIGVAGSPRFGVYVLILDGGNLKRLKLHP